MASSQDLLVTFAKTLFTNRVPFTAPRDVNEDTFYREPPFYSFHYII